MKAFAINICLWLTLMALTYCMKPSPVPPPIFTAQVYYKTQNGADLLNPKNQGSFNKDGITVSNFWISNGAKTETSASIPCYNSCDSLICQSSDGYRICFVIGSGYKSTGTLIRLNSTTVDTLIYEKMPANATYGVNKVLYKGQAIWTASPALTTNISLTIVK